MTDLQPAADLAADLKDHPGVNVDMDAMSAFLIVGQLKLALTHPLNVGRHVEATVAFINAVCAQMPESAQRVIAIPVRPKGQEH